MDNNKVFLKKFLILAFIIWIALLIRIPGLPFMSGDYNTFVSKWFDTIKMGGGFAALKNAMGDYTQPYLYLLTIGTYTNINKLFYVKFKHIHLFYISSSSIK